VSWGSRRQSARRGLHSAVMPPPDAYLCSITGDVMADPVSTADGFSYEREAILEWFMLGNQTSPLTGAPLVRSDLVPNHALRAAIQQYVDEHPEAGADLYRPRDTGAIRQAIHARQWAPPQAAGGCSPAAAATAPQAAEEAVPMGTAVMPVQPPPPPPLTGLTAADREAAAPYAVADWAAACAPPRTVASGGWFGFSRKETSTPRPSADEPRMRVSHPGEGDGIALEVTVSSEAAMLRLAQRLAATSAEVPLAALRLTAEDGFGPGTAAAISASGSAFALLTRCLMGTENGAGCLRGLRELAISKVTISDEAAASLAEALHGHAALQMLELWNVALEDDGALSISQLATPTGNQALTQLNLGRNLVSGPGRERIEGIIDASRVRVKVY